MADALTTITKIINSPPGQLAAGGMLAGIVWKFFERVEAVLNEHTKLDIAVWLLDAKARSFGPRWQVALTSYFKGVCGEPYSRHRNTAAVATGLLSFAVFARPVAASVDYGRLVNVYIWLLALVTVETGTLGFCMAIAMATLDAMDNLLHGMSVRLDRSWRHSVAFTSGCIIGSWFFIIGMYVFLIGMPPNKSLSELFRVRGGQLRLWDGLRLFRASGIPTAMALSSSWLWLFIISGIILKAARRFDISFGWFISKADIEKKPLQSIGLVAGALVAIVYWAVVIASRVVR